MTSRGGEGGREQPSDGVDGTAGVWDEGGLLEGPGPCPWHTFEKTWLHSMMSCQPCLERQRATCLWWPGPSAILCGGFRGEVGWSLGGRVGVRVPAVGEREHGAQEGDVCVEEALELQAEGGWTEEICERIPALPVCLY